MGHGVVISEVARSKNISFNNAAIKIHNTGRKYYMVGVLLTLVLTFVGVVMVTRLFRWLSRPSDVLPPQRSRV